MTKTHYTEFPSPIYKDREVNHLIHYTVNANPVELPDGQGWEADSHDFLETPGVLDEQDVIDHPEKYLKYIPSWDFPRVEKQYIDAIQQHMDKTAQEHGYDNIFTVCSYVTSGVERYRKEAVACVEWRDRVWTFSNDYLDKVKRGEADVVTVEEFIEMLPTIVWPV